MRDYNKSLFYSEYVEKAVKRMLDAYNFSQHLGLGKLYVGFSGGKDSVCMYGVARLSAKELGIDVLDMCEFHYNVTGIDHPEVYHLIHDKYPFVHMDMYKKSMWQIMIDKKFYPTRLMRFCCVELKERGGIGRFCAMGVRWAESSARAKRSEFESIGKTRSDGVMLNSDNTEDRKTMEHCIPKRKYVCNPIIDWTDDIVWEFIDEEKLEYCKLYDEGWDRLGCIGCPNARKAEKERMWKKYPKFKRQYIRTFDKIVKIRKEQGMSCSWKDGTDMFNQWQEK